MAEQKAKVVHGPGPRGMGGPRPKVENPGKLLKRIMADRKSTRLNSSHSK